MNAAKQPIRTQVVWPSTGGARAQGTPWGATAWGTGFRWPTTTPALVHVRRMSGRTGLGQDTSSTDFGTAATDLAMGLPSTSVSQAGSLTPLGAGQVTYTPTTTSTTSSLGQNVLQQLLSAGIQIGKQFTSYANPIYSLAPGTYYQQTPTGTVVATAGAPVPSTSLLGTSLTGIEPLLLIGGGLLLLVMMAKR